MNMKYIMYLVAAAPFVGMFPTTASAHHRGCHHAVIAQRPAYYYSQPQRQWNPIGAIMAVPRAALEVPQAALAVPGRILGGDEEAE